MKSTSSWPSRQTSRYSGFVVRTTVVVRFEQAFEIIAATMFDSSRDVHAIRRSVSVMPGGREHAPAGAVPLDRGDVVALRDRREPLLVEVDHRQLVLVVERLDDRRADLARADDEDLHRRRCTPRRGARILWLSCAPVRSLLALACVAALGAACAAGASTEQVDAARVHAAAARERLLGARLRHRREGRARSALRRRAGRPDPRAPERQAARDAAARHPPARHCRRRAGAARARVPSVLPERAQALRPVHGPRRLDEARRVPDERQHARASPRQLFSSSDPYGNHNGGMLAFGPNGRLYFTMGDGGAGGDPENRSQNMRSLFGKLLSINVATKGLKIEALGLRNAWRFSFDRANGDLYIGDVGQGDVEEIDYTPAREPGPRELRLGRLRGPLEVRGQAARDRQARRCRSRSTAHDDGCSVTGGYVYRGSNASLRGRYIYGDYCSGNVWSFKIAGGKATALRRERFRDRQRHLVRRGHRRRALRRLARRHDLPPDALRARQVTDCYLAGTGRFVCVR